MRLRTLLLVGTVATASLGAPLGAQVALVSTADLQGEPGARPLGSIQAGARVTAGRREGDHVQVTLTGFMDSTMLRAAKSGPFALIVRADNGARLRGGPSASAPVLAEMRGGVGLSLLSRRGPWMEVRRTGWLRASAVGLGASPGRAPVAAAKVVPVSPSRSGGATAAPPSVRGAPKTAAPSAAQRMVSDSAMPDAMTPVRALTLRDSPEGERHVAQVPAGRGSVVRPLARDRGWVRIRVEGWVPESDLAPADSAQRVPLSAADLRADPRGARGKVVRWDVEVLALQVADPLRRDLAVDEPYLLARGPGTETALLYLAVPPSLLNAARALPALTPITVTARVRNGRSEPVGIPILDLQSITRR